MEASKTTPQATASPKHPASPLRPTATTPSVEPSFIKLDCFQCSARFVMDVEEQWAREPLEMEVVGRQFLGVPPDEVLCPRCLHEVETAGAERMYWARAGR